MSWSAIIGNEQLGMKEQHQELADIFGVTREVKCRFVFELSHQALCQRLVHRQANKTDRAALIQQGLQQYALIKFGATN